jgi:putative DNA modification/repair radical SAM protein
MEIAGKLAILADAAKYDASCASSGAKGRKAAPGGIGSTEGTGICHSYTPDGRCVSLLKILLTNVCIYDCSYCINRRSSDVRRTRFTVSEVVSLTLDFYRRNYIEGLFLSSGIIRNPDYTMEQLVAVARTLRREHGFAGYIHLKTIPDASPELLDEAGRWADRLSINVELPTEGDLERLAPEKKLVQITGAMHRMRDRIAEAKEDAAGPRRTLPVFAPGGQSTQMIVGATESTDATILGTASRLYEGPRLRRVYYSGFSPIPDASAALPLIQTPLVREHRLYQADWLMRFYGFRAAELTTPERPNLDLELDPKVAWALRNRERFPVDVNRAPREELLRVPGFGARNVKRILAARQWRAVRLADLARLKIPLKRAMPFIVTADHAPVRVGPDTPDLRDRIAPKRQQLDLFATAAAARHGEL